MGCYNSGIVAQTVNYSISASEVNRRFNQFAQNFGSRPSSLQYVDKQSIVKHMIVVSKILESTPILCYQCDGKILQPMTSIPVGMETCSECDSTGMYKAKHQQYAHGCRVCKSRSSCNYGSLYRLCNRCRGGGVVPLSRR